jgi:hypothetical protein
MYASFEESQQQLDVALRSVLEQLSRAQARRVEFLQSVKRQVLSQMLFLQWLENYQAHARLALPPSDYLVSARRHEHLVAALFGDRATGMAMATAASRSAGDIGPMPPWMDEDLTIEGQMQVWLISAPNPEPEQSGKLPPGVYPGGVNPLERGMMLEASMGAPTGGVGLAPNVVPSGPGLFDMAALPPTGMLGFSDEGASYLEAAPRGGRRSPSGYPGQDPATAHGIGGPSDTMYARRPGAIDPAPWPGSPVQPGASPGRKGGKFGNDQFDSFISSALAYLDTAEQRITDGRVQPVAGTGPRPPAIATDAARSGAASLQLPTEVLVELRAGGEGYGGPPGQWGCLLTLLSACPSTERNELMLKALTVASPFGDANAQLARRVVEDDVRRAQFPSLLASAHGLHASLVHAMLRLDGKAGFLDPELSVLVREAKNLPARLDDAAASVAMHRSIGDFLSSISRVARAGDGRFPTSLQTVSHYLYAAAEEKFGILAAQNAVATLIVSRVITPSLLRVAQRRDADVGGPGLNDRVSSLSRLLQRIAHFAHHDDEGQGRGQVVEDAVLRHISSLREFVSRLLVLPSYPTLGLEVSAQAAEEGAAWIVAAARRWGAGLDSIGAPGADPSQASRQLAAASQRIEKLHAPGVSANFNNQLDAASARAAELQGAYHEAMTVFGSVGPPHQPGHDYTNAPGGGRTHSVM